MTWIENYFLDVLETKQKNVNFFLDIIKNNIDDDYIFIEPFCGFASVPYSVVNICILKSFILMIYIK